MSCKNNITCNIFLLVFEISERTNVLLFLVTLTQILINKNKLKVLQAGNI